jgi:hypothetical protein
VRVPSEAQTPLEGGVQCGREDSNLHENYLTRSLADLADQKANEFTGASRSGTAENTLGRTRFSPVVKNLARDVLRAVADGGDMPIARVHDFARAVIETPEDASHLPVTDAECTKTGHLKMGEIGHY